MLLLCYLNIFIIPVHVPDSKDIVKNLESMDRSGAITLGAPYFRITADKITYHFDSNSLSPYDSHESDGSGLDSYPVRLAMVICKIKKYRMETEKQSTFWKPVIATLHTHIDGMLATLSRNDIGDNQKHELLSDQLHKSLEYINDELNSLAKREGKKDGAEYLVQRMVNAITTKFALEPTRGQIKTMSDGKWITFYVHNGRRPNWDDGAWTAVVQNAQTKLAKTTRIIAKWDDGTTLSELVVDAPKSIVVSRNRGIIRGN